MNTLERFFDSFVPEPNSGCWLWEKSLDTHGYGRIKVDGRSIGAHRFAYQRFVGRMPRELHVDHLCRTRSCCNPAHLEAVTCGENIRRGGGVGGENARKTHCPSGHPLSGANLYATPRGHRDCRTCRREAGKRYRDKARAALKAAEREDG